MDNRPRRCVRLKARTCRWTGKTWRRIHARLEKGGFTTEEVLGDWFPDPPWRGVRQEAAATVLQTRLTDKLDIRHPVLLAPTGFVSGGALAAAVSAAGGPGIIAGGYADPEWLEREAEAALARRFT